MMTRIKLRERNKEETCIKLRERNKEETCMKLRERNKEETCMKLRERDKEGIGFKTVLSVCNTPRTRRRSRGGGGVLR